jgi:hypothetical protein
VRGAASKLVKAPIVAPSIKPPINIPERLLDILIVYLHTLILGVFYPLAIVKGFDLVKEEDKSSVV